MSLVQAPEGPKDKQGPNQALESNLLASPLPALVRAQHFHKLVINS